MEQQRRSHCIAFEPTYHNRRHEVFTAMPSRSSGIGVKRQGQLVDKVQEQRGNSSAAQHSHHKISPFDCIGAVSIGFGAPHVLAAAFASFDRVSGTPHFVGLGQQRKRSTLKLYRNNQDQKHSKGHRATQQSHLSHLTQELHNPILSLRRLRHTQHGPRAHACQGIED